VNGSLEINYLGVLKDNRCKIRFLIIIIIIKKTKKWHLSGRDRSGEALKWHHISRNIEGHNIEDKIHCTVSKLDETWLKSSLAILSLCKSTTTG
jgi:hypothetical protein